MTIEREKLQRILRRAVKLQILLLPAFFPMENLTFYAGEGVSLF